MAGRCRGTVHVLHAFDVGQAVDLAEARRHVTDRIEPSRLEHKRRAPPYFQFEPPPLRILQPSPLQEVGGRPLAPLGETVLYDFGALSVRHGLPFEGSLEDLADLSAALADAEGLAASARRRAQEVLDVVGGAVTGLRVAPMVEDYLVFQLEDVEGEGPLEDLLGARGPLVARVLASSREAPSREEVEDLQPHRASFGGQDLVVVDWNGALVAGRDMDDVVDVLEYANVQLLEMRFLDDRLDLDLDRAYASLAEPRRGRLGLAPARPRLERIARMQVDGAILFERVGNAIKLLGDQWLARVYRLAARRFHLAEWNAGILRKLDALESIYQKLFDRASTRRMEALEWLIILLIAVSIALPFLAP